MMVSRRGFVGGALAFGTLGAFTSIGAGCIHEGAGGFNYDSSCAQ